MKIEILGGCGEYGRNCYYVEKNGKAILLDCGVMNDESQRLPELTKAHIDQLQAVFISHLHWDHVGTLSLLISANYRGPVIVSKATYEWISPKFDLNYLIFEERKKQEITEHLAFQWGFSGHVIGSVWYDISFENEQIFYSGDVALESNLSPLDIPEGKDYKIALIEAGNAGDDIDNQSSLAQMRAYIEKYPAKSFKVKSKFTAKSLEILVYFYQFSERTLVLDEFVYDWLIFYHEQAHSLSGSGQKLIAELLKSPRLVINQEQQNSLYFIHELNKSTFNIELDEKLNKIPFKTHLDTKDILEFSGYLRAEKTIYFHSADLTPNADLSEIINLKRNGK